MKGIIFPGVLLLTLLVISSRNLFGSEPVMSQVVAHRGLMQEAPENTIINFRSCLVSGMGFEFDVQLTKDGQLVCIHDGELERTTNGTGKASDLLLSEIRQLDAGSWFDDQFKGAQVPTVEEVFELLSDSQQPDLVIAVDLKISGVEQQIVKLAQEKGVLDQLLFIGHTISQPEVRHELREASPQAHTAALANTPEEFEQALKAVDADWVYLRFLPTQEQMQQVHTAQKRAFIAGKTVSGKLPLNWTKAKEVGIDAILTDHPRELDALLKGN
ncbi:MAG: glycerophosphodiester phosphodiesterase family protein [Planctomycetaceae bacterium]